MVLDNNFISVNQKRINLTGFNSSTVIGGSNNQSSWYKNLAWTGTQTFDGSDGNDMVIVSSNQNLFMEPTLLTLGTGPFKLGLANLDAFKYKAFDPALGPASSTDSTVTLHDLTGTCSVDSGDGNDLLIVNKAVAITDQTMEIEPSALTLNGKIIQLAKSDPRARCEVGPRARQVIAVGELGGGSEIPVCRPVHGPNAASHAVQLTPAARRSREALDCPC